MVVDGFRNNKPDQMDAFQYFFDSKGNQVGYAPVGTLEFDRRDGHNHWHFTDFAQYYLLDKDKQNPVRSGKESFCLGNTDAMDYTLPGALWKPWNTDLHSICGSQDMLSIRESLDVGNGDTYWQDVPGQVDLFEGGPHVGTQRTDGRASSRRRRAPPEPAESPTTRRTPTSLFAGLK